MSSVQFSSVAQSCPALCDPMNCHTPGFPVHRKMVLKNLFARQQWRNRHRELTYGHGERGGENNMETFITICKIGSQQEFDIWLRKLNQGLCINLGNGMGREVQKEGDICIAMAD